MVDAVDLQVPRFAANELKIGFMPPIRHFHPITPDHRDRFGNRVFSAHALPGVIDKLKRPAYVDPEGRVTRAALLVSQEGDQFIKQNPGILNALDKGLTSLQAGQKVIDLGLNRTLSYLDHGAQSDVGILEIAGKKYVIKTRTKKNMYWQNLSQPYINEMLQIQAMKKDLASNLKAIQVEFPTYYFSSGQMVCRSFEEGIVPVDNEDFAGKWGKLFDLVNDYIDKKNMERDALWNGMNEDFYAKGYVRKTNNFVQKQDGILVCIDPLFYGGTKNQPNKF